ncbi:thioredoxin family protein [Aureimonas sp. AU20]|uniref:DUF1223 domain-containing protein n=1 Tax=Aureimonas sp. AU20 TaxID=1349819 RepID=UPI000722EEBD|nr:DUF1223 domain-containing protein [Aureimonas sp. AU20]ALN71676.1 hypothetical protein M673_03065 [Aureimonas sp. AU20]
MTPPSLAALAFAAAALVSAPSARADESGAEATSRTVRGIVELFTSQGCAECPKADAVLARLAARPDYVALAYHVDYWDYIGWEDPLGSRRNAERQKGYSKAMRLGGLSTPQAIVNGQAALGGADEAAIERAVGAAPLPGADGQPTIEMRLSGDTLSLRVAAGPQPEGARPPALILATYAKTTSTQVARGENQGRQLLNTHAVRDWRAVGVIGPDGRLSVDMPLGLLADPDAEAGGCVALIQAMDKDDRPGRILAAAALRF